jgi:NTP pyrophosphatase (non-canonical NTP hydrolase)
MGVSFRQGAYSYDYFNERFKLVTPAEEIPTHPNLVAALVKPGEKIVSELTGSDANLLHMVIGISGEAGELLDAIKKAVIYRKELDRVNVIEELGDIEFYLEGLRQELGVSREECLAANVAKLQKRYGDKYSDSAAQIRADKE